MKRSVVKVANVDLTKGPILCQLIACVLVPSDGVASVVVKLHHREMFKTGLSGAECKPAGSTEDFDSRQVRPPRNVRNRDSSNVGFSKVHSQITRTLQPARARRAR